MSSKITELQPDRDVVKGDIVQIDPAHDKCFGGCFMVVTEPKSWGAQGYFDIPKEPEEGEDYRKLAYYRCKKEHYVIVGHVEWLCVSKDEANESDPDRSLSKDDH